MLDMELRSRLCVLAGLAALLTPVAPVCAQREPEVQKELRERFGEWAEQYAATVPSYTATETVELTRFKRGEAQSPQRLAFRYSLRRYPAKPRELVESRQQLPAEASPVPPGAQSTSAVPGRGGDTLPRELNDSSFSKLFLLPTRLATRSHEIMKYFFAQDDTDRPGDTVLVGYRQFTGDGLLELEGKLVFPTGRAWIDPETGRPTRMEEEFGAKDIRYWVAVDFAAEGPHWLPSHVSIRVFEKGRLTSQTNYAYESIRILKE
jgi:hypothetical protein